MRWQVTYTGANFIDSNRDELSGDLVSLLEEKSKNEFLREVACAMREHEANALPQSNK